MTNFIIERAGAKCDINVVSKRRGVGAIHLAVTCRAPEIVQLLLDSGACPSIPETEFGNSPAILAVLTSQLDVLKQIVKFGAELNYENYAGMTVLMTALELADREVIFFLLSEAKCDPNFGTIRSPLEICCTTKEEEMAILLLNYGADARLCVVEGAGGGGINLLQASIKFGWEEVQAKVCDYFSSLVEGRQLGAGQNGLWMTIK